MTSIGLGIGPTRNPRGTGGGSESPLVSQWICFLDDLFVPIGADLARAQRKDLLRSC